MGIAEGLTQPSRSLLLQSLQLLKKKLLFWDTRNLYSSDQRIYKFLSEKVKQEKGDEE